MWYRHLTLTAELLTVDLWTTWVHKKICRQTLFLNNKYRTGIKKNLKTAVHSSLGVTVEEDALSYVG